MRCKYDITTISFKYNFLKMYQHNNIKCIFYWKKCIYYALSTTTRLFSVYLYFVQQPTFCLHDNDFKFVKIKF